MWFYLYLQLLTDELPLRNLERRDGGILQICHDGIRENSESFGMGVAARGAKFKVGDWMKCCMLRWSRHVVQMD